MEMLRVAVAIFFLFVLSVGVDGSGLSYDFYDKSCPQVECIVRAGLQSISTIDPTSPAAMLRLMFHDCQVQGCDASILVDPSDENKALEITSTKNFGIRKREAISIIKSMVEVECPLKVSCADILVLTARDAVAMSGGPMIKVPLGRRDSSSIPSHEVADSSLPSANIGVDDMLRIFSMKGMTIEESVAIMGAHTLGITHCFNVRNRLYRPEGGEAADKIETGFELLLRLACPQESLTTNTTFVLNDPTTFLFDNQYYMNAMGGRGVLRIDAEMPSDPRTARIVAHFGMDQDAFYKAFTSAFVKLAASGVLTGKQGVIRKYCNVMD